VQIVITNKGEQAPKYFKKASITPTKLNKHNLKDEAKITEQGRQQDQKREESE
jgi:hypothetical protein